MPLFSILTPVFNTPHDILAKTIRSVLEQTNCNWEWCVVDDASTNSGTIEALKALALQDSRVKLTTRKHNGGITEASQDALEIASGEFIVLLDHDDMLRSDALDCIADLVTEKNDIDYLYSDEDKVDADDNHYDEFLKPDWSPERLRGQNYCCHVSVMRRSLVNRVGGFRPGFEGSQDYDLILRVTEQARQIVHIPEVLYHWRAIPGSTAMSVDEKPSAFFAAKRAVQEHLERVQILGEVVDAGFGYHRVKRELTSNPLISIIIPTCGSSHVIGGVDTCLVLNAIRSINDHTTYRNFEIIVVADNHTPAHVLSEIRSTFYAISRVVMYDKPFNFSEKCNTGYASSRGELVLLLNDDIQIITPDWLETLVPLALESDVGLVGPMLQLESGLIQSAGHSNTGLPHNFRAGARPDSSGEFGVLAITRESSGITGAAAMCRREVYEEVGGLSITFPNCFNDVDFAYKILERGYRILWTPFAKLYHFESVTRDATVDERELRRLTDRWGRFFDHDRFIRLY